MSNGVTHYKYPVKKNCLFVGKRCKNCETKIQIYQKWFVIYNKAKFDGATSSYVCLFLVKLVVIRRRIRFSWKK